MNIEKVTKEDLLEMELHDRIKTGSNDTYMEILRVLSGWIYVFPDGLLVFVPEAK